MMECCNLTYQKYINPDKSIDYIALMNILKEFGARSCKDGLRIAYPLNKKLCECDCHRKDMQVMH